MHFIPASAGEFIPAAHEVSDKPGVLKRVIATAEQLQLGQVQMLNWARLQPHASFQPHYHEDMQEIFVLIRGEVMMEVGEQTVTMRDGDTVIVPPRVVHRMLNASHEVAEYLVFGISSQSGGKTVLVPG